LGERVSMESRLCAPCWDGPLALRFPVPDLAVAVVAVEVNAVNGGW